MTFSIDTKTTHILSVTDADTGYESEFTLSENDTYPFIDSIKYALEDDADETGVTGTSTFMADNGENFTIYRIEHDNVNVVRIEANTAEASIDPDEAHQILEILPQL